MPRHLTFLLVLPTILLSACFVYAQQNTDTKSQRKEIERLRKAADSLRREASKLESEFSELAEAFSDSMFSFSKKYSDSLSGWTRKFSDSLLQRFQLEEVPFFSVPKNQPRYYPEPKEQWMIEPRPDERNVPPAPRVIPKRRDSKELPNFPGWRIDKLQNLTEV
jgi:hypothetical protein